jgi:RimJ/RimL family protein N-acetyltransferase
MSSRDRADVHQLGAATVIPGRWSRRAALRDGTRVLLRQIRPEDREQLAAGLRELSPASRYLRFHDDIEELTAEQLDYLTHVDHLDHEAIVAIDLDQPELPGVGVARYIRDPYQRHIAEAAITVADRYQGKGAATLLLGALTIRGRDHGVEVFRNYVLADNTSMLDVFDHLGATRELETDGLWRVDLALPGRASDLPDSAAGRAFMAAATRRSPGQGSRRAAVRPPAWLRWLGSPAGRREDRAGLVDEVDDPDGELDAWLADREHRTAVWPSDTPTG